MKTYFTHIDSPIGRLMLTANDRALTGLYFSTGDKAKQEPDPAWQLCQARFEQAQNELNEYFAGARQQFNVALEPRATPFQNKVLAALNLIPFGKVEASTEGAAGYNAGRDRGANACVNRMGTFPQVTRRWWVEEFKELSEKQRAEVEAETAAAYKLAAERGTRYRQKTRA